MENCVIFTFPLGTSIKSPQAGRDEMTYLDFLIRRRIKIS